MPQLSALAADYNLVHAIHIGLIYSSEIAFASARAHHIPFVFTPFPHDGGWEGRRFRRLYRLSDAVIAMTATEKAWLIERDADPERVHVCGGGPVLAETGSAARFLEDFGLKGPIVLFIGQRLRHKGYAELIAAMPTVWAHYPTVQSVFLGPMTPEAQPLFEEATVDPRVIDLGISISRRRLTHSRRAVCCAYPLRRRVWASYTSRRGPTRSPSSQHIQTSPRKQRAPAEAVSWCLRLRQGSLKRYSLQILHHPQLPLVKWGTVGTRRWSVGMAGRLLQSV